MPRLDGEVFLFGTAMGRLHRHSKAENRGKPALTAQSCLKLWRAYTRRVRLWLVSG
jgi:hypothetical protein